MERIKFNQFPFLSAITIFASNIFLLFYLSFTNYGGTWVAQRGII